MGYSLAERTWFRALLVAALFATSSASTAAAYPYAKSLLRSYQIDYYVYEPVEPVEAIVDTSRMPPATGVPVLMYHGVTEEYDDYNTTIENFVAQMEMLKKEGYETISVADFDRFRKGELVLPPKPVIITFDDGRKDSFYTTDDILKKLGFTATLFIASGPTIDGNSFYLTWDEYRTLRDSGRWELEGHGRYSHEKIRTAPGRGEDSQGRYLMSKMYLPGADRLETDREFAERVTGDYVANIADMQSELGIVPTYFAIPLNDYGQQAPSNHPGAPAVNDAAIRASYRIAFIQANSPDRVTRMNMPVYNFKDDDPYRTRRIEVKNMSAADLRDILAREYPVPPSLAASGLGLRSAPTVESSRIGLHQVTEAGYRVIAEAPDTNGRVAFGQPHWDGYEVEAVIRRDDGRSLTMLLYYQDSTDFVVCGYTDDGFYLRAMVNGHMRDLAPMKRLALPRDGYRVFSGAAHDGLVSCSYDGVPLYTSVMAPHRYGAVGMKVWSDTERGSATLRSLTVRPF